MRHIFLSFLAFSLLVSAVFGLGFFLSANAASPAEEVYRDWKTKFVTASGAGAGELRVWQPDKNGITVSEGQGYGMLLAVFAGDRPVLDGLWKYAKRYRDSRGLMHWKIAADGIVTGENAATDGDEDIAYALLRATQEWGDTYRQDALQYMGAIWMHEVEAGTYVLKPGDVWGGSDAFNPSYCAPAFYREFAKFTGNRDWLKVSDKCFEIIEKARHPITGLIPEWTTAEGRPTLRVTHNANKDNFSYNAIRVPWRMAMDWEWSGDQRARAITQLMTQFFAGQKSLKSGYMLEGTPLVSYFDTTFAAGIAAGAKASSFGEFAKTMTERLWAPPSSSYYGATLRALGIFFLSGIFRPFEAVIAPLAPAPAPPPPPSAITSKAEDLSPPPPPPVTPPPPVAPPPPLPAVVSTEEDVSPVPATAG
ncbi:MAG: glycosyl hydrolase family 8, partial [Patescibacteria group bacterium]